MAFVLSRSTIIPLFLTLSGAALAAGGATFIAPSAYLNNANPSVGYPSIQTGDFNGDGKTDIAVVANSSSINVVLGNGDGTFQPPISTNTVQSGIALLAVGDFNNDGHPDVLLDTDPALQDQFQIWLGDGKGSFTPGASFSTGTAAVVAGDFNQDGSLDIAAVNESTAAVYLNNGNGAFAAPVSRAISGGGAGYPWVYATDLNQDGHLDLIIDYPAFMQSDIIPLLGNGKGGFTEGPPTTGPIPGGAVGFVTADFNQDGIPDVADCITNVFLGSIRVFFGTGNGTFAAPVSYNIFPEAGIGQFVFTSGLTVASPKTTPSGQPSGPPDIFILGNMSAMYELPNTGSGIFTTAVQVVAGSVVGLAAGDFNGDGLTDLATANYTPVASDKTGAILLSTAEGVWTQPASNMAAGKAPQSEFTSQNAAFGDFNHDGIVDALLATGELSLGIPGQKYAAPVPVGPANAVAVIVADFNNDGCLDAAFASGSSIIVMFGNGDGTFGPPATYTTSGAITALATADFNNDGLPDIAAANNGDFALTILLGLGKGTFAQPVDFPIDNPGNGLLIAIATGEFDGEGCPDVAILAAGQIYVFLGLANGTFQTSTSVALPADTFLPFSLLAADVTRDGNTDLVVGYASFSSETTNVLVYPGNPSGVFPDNPTPLSLVGSATALAFTDVNGDGLPDLIGCGISGDIGVALGFSRGFSAPQKYYAGVTCTQIYAGRIDPTHWGISALTGNQTYGQGGTYYVPIILEKDPPALPDFHRPDFPRISRN